MKKIALVTGAGSGIGRAASLALARTGFEVVLAGRRPEALVETATRIAAGGGESREAPTDLADPDAIVALFDLIRAQYGRLDLLFNNAGTGAPPKPLEDLTLDQWRMVVDVNLTAPFLCTQQAFSIMKAQSPMGGRIINNGSISAHAPRPNTAPYTATKHAITGLTRASSLDGRRYNIAVGQIDIGNAATEMTARMAHGMPQPDGSVRPEPLMDVNHVADAIAYMAGLPLDANVQFMTVMATQMPFVGRG